MNRYRGLFQPLPKVVSVYLDHFLVILHQWCLVVWSSNLNPMIVDQRSDCFQRRCSLCLVFQARPPTARSIRSDLGNLGHLAVHEIRTRQSRSHGSNAASTAEMWIPRAKKQMANKKYLSWTLWLKFCFSLVFSGPKFPNFLSPFPPFPSKQGTPGWKSQGLIPLPNLIARVAGRDRIAGGGECKRNTMQLHQLQRGSIFHLLWLVWFYNFRNQHQQIHIKVTMMVKSKGQ